MPLFDPATEQLERRSNVGRWQVVRVTFTTVDTDLIIPHTLPTPDPEQISYQVLNITGPGVIYHDGSATRAPWGNGFIRLRARVVPVTCDLLLTVMATEVGTTRVPQGASTTPTSDADTLDGLDSTAFAQNAFKTVAVSGQSDVVADSPTDTLTLAAGSGITLTTNAGTDTVTITGTAGATDVTAAAVIPDNAIVRGDGGARGVQDSLLTISDLGAIAFPDNVSQVFNPGTVNAGINVGALAGDPTTPVNGDLWYDSTANELTARVNGANVALGAGSSVIVQVVNTQTGAVATGTTTIPIDDTIPQNTEGNEYMTLAITPTSTTNKLKIDVVFFGAYSVAAWLIVALFQDTTAGALATFAGYQQTASGANHSTFTHYMTAGTTSATTFKVRAGGNTAGTTTFNGQNAGRLFGGVCASSITITEIKV